MEDEEVGYVQTALKFCFSQIRDMGLQLKGEGAGLGEECLYMTLTAWSIKIKTDKLDLIKI